MQHFKVINYKKLINKFFFDTYCIIDWNVLYWRNAIYLEFFHYTPNVGVFPNKLCLWGEEEGESDASAELKPLNSLWIQRDPSEHKMLATLFDSLIISWEEK